MVVAPLLWMTLVGCESEEEIAADMERSLRETNVALVGALVSAEMLAHVYDEPDRQLRHGYDVCGCPCTEKIGENAPYVMTLDYDPSGCVPETGLLPTALAGHAVVDFDGAECNVAWDGLKFALEHDVDGDLEGAVAADGAELTIDADGVISVGAETITVDLRFVLDDTGVTIDGKTTVASDDPRPIELAGVHLAFEDLAPPCPAPGAGTATLVNADSDKKSVVVDFAVPGDGFVQVRRDDRVSESADWCAYASDLW